MFINFFYGFRLISPFTHIVLRILADLLFFVFLVVYANALSIAEPVQRALIIFGSSLTHSIFRGKSNHFPVMPYCLCIQAFAFPLSFFSTSNSMSWIAYFIASSPNSGSKEDLMWNSMTKQLLLTLTAAAIFGEISIIGIVANPLLSRFLPSLLITGLTLILFPGLFQNFGAVFVKYHQIFIEICQFFYEHFKDSQFLHINVHTYNGLRLILGLVVALCLLKIYSQRPIRGNADN